MKFKTILNEMILYETSSTTLAAFPITLKLGDRPENTEKLMSIFIGYIPKLEGWSWNQFITKFGKMTFSEFAKKINLNVDQFSKSILKTFPRVNETTLKMLK